ncbi:MAG: hypothetical protein J6T18_03115 [Bacteroidaceae bacterium]|nr:hypothetical protein [Bacteroidaceae bacterium]MBP5646877.1 hypothetical protein [Bacteroidaceae bacterium]
MKQIEEIESIGYEELERIASDNAVRVPAGLDGKIVRTAKTLEFMTGTLTCDKPSGRKKRRAILIPSAAAAAAAVIAVAFSLSAKAPSDTYDDPAMALAGLEQTFTYISEKLNYGAAIASSAEPVFRKTINVLK